MADDIKPLKGGAAGTDGRVGGLARPPEFGGIQSTKPTRRLRDRFPTRAQLDALVASGRLILPARYIRGFFLDIVI